MNSLTSKKYFLPMAMLPGTVWIGGDAIITLHAIDNFVNDFGLHRVYETDIFGVRK